MTNALTGKGIYGFGIEPLLDLPWDDPEDAWDFVEHVRMHGTVPSDTEGSVLGTDSAYNNRRCWFVGGGHGLAHKVTYEEWINKDHRTPKEKQRDDLIEHWRELKREKDEARQDREAYELALKQSNAGLRSWADREDKRFESTEVRAERMRVEAYRRESALILQRKADEEHERRRLWSIEVSEIERTICESTENIDCSALDRAMMRTMLRYQNFGPGKGKRWDAQEFVLYISATRRDQLLMMTLLDVERCYNTLKKLVVNA